MTQAPAPKAPDFFELRSCTSFSHEDISSPAELLDFGGEFFRTRESAVAALDAYRREAEELFFDSETPKDSDGKMTVLVHAKDAYPDSDAEDAWLVFYAPALDHESELFELDPQPVYYLRLFGRNFK